MIIYVYSRETQLNQVESVIINGSKLNTSSYNFLIYSMEVLIYS